MPARSRPMPMGQVTGAVRILSTLSISSSSSMGGRPSRSSLLMNVMMGVSRMRHTSISLMVRSSTPFAQSMTISALSTAVNVRYVSSEKSSCPGVSSRLMTAPRNGNCITDEVMEIPRCFSSAIQSEVAWRAALRPLTVPASWMAPPNSSSFSVSVVLPASGCEMMANVRRRAVSCPVEVICWKNRSAGWFGPDLALEHDGVFAPVGGLIIPATDADMFEAEPLIEPDGGQVAGAHFEEGLCDAGRRRAFHQVLEQAPPETHAAEFVAHAHVEDVRLARPQAHDSITDDPALEIERAAGVTHAQAVAEDVLAPRERITALLDGGDLGQVDLHHRPDVHF